MGVTYPPSFPGLWVEEDEFAPQGSGAMFP